MLIVFIVGDIVRGVLVGIINLNDVGFIFIMGLELILGIGWVNLFVLVCKLMILM